MLGIFYLSLHLPASSQNFAAIHKDKYHVDKEGPRKIKGMTLVWNDEFNTDGRPDFNNWDYENGFVRNHELQWYQAQNANCKDGRLIITGKQDSIINPYYSTLSNDWRLKREVAEFSSACLITKDLQEFKGQGYFEVRAKIDTTSGSWPAIWLLGTKNEWPHNGEIDMMEFYRINGESTILANVAWGTEQKYQAKWDQSTKPLSHFTQKDVDWANQYHVWGMWWDENVIKLYLDNELLNEIPMKNTINPDGKNPFATKNEFYILLNLALGSNGDQPDVNHFPITFEVDYVRVYAPTK